MKTKMFFAIVVLGIVSLSCGCLEGIEVPKNVTINIDVPENITIPESVVDSLAQQCPECPVCQVCPDCICPEYPTLAPCEVCDICPTPVMCEECPDGITWYCDGGTRWTLSSYAGERLCVLKHCEEQMVVMEAEIEACDAEIATLEETIERRTAFAQELTWDFCEYWCNIERPDTFDECCEECFEDIIEEIDGYA